MRQTGFSTKVGSTTEIRASSDVIVVTTAWDEFRRLEPSDVERSDRPRVLVDCWRIFPAELFGPVADYVAVGEGVNPPGVRIGSAGS